MPKRQVIHVTPDGDNWKVQRTGSARPSKVFDNKSDAVGRAIDQAKNQPLSQVVIHKKDGTIQTEHTYGKDPYPPKG